MKTDYEIGKYAKAWGIFSKTSKAWVLFGPKKQMKARCKELNDEATR